MDGPPRTTAATAALVLGLLSLALLLYSSRFLTRDFGHDVYVTPVSTLGPLIMGLLAIGLGGLGLRAAGAGAKCRGRSIVGIILGVLALALELIPYLRA